ncbi:tartrate dehydrogenase [Alicyclobacillus cycloheptanicus]|uniref:D-malate dehydrogenase (decarboxylating) n=1 Tax=Alicyclobacillus cycloheptanicus TaxID=1457 RepID=A0ABT9XHS4_9BACL|nr:tartrate dehydrogenase [Alicyclobacillus cycloheptanicus]MDQ0189866.1 tartrate dehydrogenase/decarboxylase/D-malate dehydrogenase [Alicyclobacillus cycloheptanicus]WDM02452.1 tartrate dehydrogenase [Alicyclobacillus cycloheptanicus]
MNKHAIAVIPGDGIGQEVVPEALKVLETAAQIHGGIAFEWTTFPWGCEYYLQHETMMPSDGIETLKSFEQIFLGAVGMPGLVPDHISLGGLLLKIRQELEQSINVRPAKLLCGMKSPLADPQSFDILVVRENSEGEYSDVGGRVHNGPDEMALQTSVFTRKACARVMEYALSVAQRRRRHVTSATKSNGLAHSMPFWDDVFRDVSQAYPDIQTTSMHIDALAALFVMKPHVLDVVVASNLFGDILSDIGGAIMGSIGIAPAANLNVERKYPSMFEPVHGSAPDIAGKGIANPIGQIWTAKMMLDFLGYEDIASVVLYGIEETLVENVKTADLGGSATMTEVTERVIAHMKAAAK